MLTWEDRRRLKRDSWSAQKKIEAHCVQCALTASHTMAGISQLIQILWGILSYKSLWSFFKYSKGSGLLSFGVQKNMFRETAKLEKSENVKNPLVKKNHTKTVPLNFFWTSYKIEMSASLEALIFEKSLSNCFFFPNLTLISEMQSLDFIIFGPKSYGDVLIFDPILSVLIFSWEANQNKKIFWKVEIKVIFWIRLKSFFTLLYGMYIRLFICC